ncbi:MAG: sigma-70 family RNA polymerase sigma factor [Phycisphaerae bacterium]|nr:sigma-70 family RNA polymerase sigma factor [Phycisphaerae bacterium]
MAMAQVSLAVDDLMGVVSHFQGPLLRYVGHMLGYGDHEIEDIVQETFIRLHRQVRKRGPSSVQHLSNWLFRVAHNQTLDVIRKRSRQKHKPGVPLDQADAQAQVANDMDALGEMLRQESRQVALQALSQLAPDIKQVLLLKIIQGMSLREVAEIVGVSLSTVNYRLNQGLTELAGRLKRAGVV